MREVLQALLIAGVVMWTGCILAVLWGRSRLRRTLRIDPAVRSAAPTSWAVVPTPAARLHRRLRAAAAAARLASTADRALAPLADDLVGEALALEPRILLVSGTRRVGASARRELSAELSELEAVARRLTHLSSASAPGAATRLRDRVTALEAARHEVAEIDLRAGLVRHS